MGGLVSRRLHTISAIRSDVLFRVVLALYHSRVCVMGRAPMFRWTLTQRVSVDLVHHFLALSHREQPTRFFPLASKPLLNKKSNSIEYIDYKMLYAKKVIFKDQMTL